MDGEDEGEECAGGEGGAALPYRFELESSSSSDDGLDFFGSMIYKGHFGQFTTLLIVTVVCVY